MEGHSKSSHKYLLLQVWCGLLTVAIVVMAAILTSIKLKSTEDEDVVSTVKPLIDPTRNNLLAHFKSDRSPLSYIQLMKSLNDRSWEESPGCTFCSLTLQNNTIHCLRDSLYFIYAQVTFTKLHNHTKSVILTRDATLGKNRRTLVQGTLGATEGSVWVAKIVRLGNGDSVSLDVVGDFLRDRTFWGAFELL